MRARRLLLLACLTLALGACGGTQVPSASYVWTHPEYHGTNASGHYACRTGSHSQREHEWVCVSERTGSRKLTETRVIQTRGAHGIEATVCYEEADGQSCHKLPNPPLPAFLGGK
jgi:hypothetical protein